MLSCFQYFSLQLYLICLLSHCYSTEPVGQLDDIMFSLQSSVLMPERGSFFVDYHRVIGVHSTNGHYLFQ